MERPNNFTYKQGLGVLWSQAQVDQMEIRNGALGGQLLYCCHIRIPWTTLTFIAPQSEWMDERLMRIAEESSQEAQLYLRTSVTQRGGGWSGCSLQPDSVMWSSAWLSVSWLLSFASEMLSITLSCSLKPLWTQYTNTFRSLVANCWNGATWSCCSQVKINSKT